MNHTYRRVIALLLTLVLAFTACGDSMSALADVLKLPAAVKRIEERAFYGDTSLDEVIIPSGAEYIGDEAFAYSSVTNIEIPETVTTIAENAFEGAEHAVILAEEGTTAYAYAAEHGLLPETDMQMIGLGENLIPTPGGASVRVGFIVPQTGKITFASQGNRDTIGAILDSNENLLAEDDDSGEGSNFSVTYFLEEGQKVYLDVSYFDVEDSDENMLVMVSVAQPVQTSGSCGDDLTWSLSDMVLTISGTGEMSFGGEWSPWEAYTDDIVQVVIENGVTSIAPFAFIRADRMKSITIPGSVQVIGEQAFYGCSKLQEITIPNGVVSIGGSAFGDCWSLRSVVISDSVTEVGSHAFAWCSRLEKATLGTGMTTVPEGMFAGSGIKQVVIPATVTEIGENAFSATALQQVIFQGTMAQWQQIIICAGNAKLMYSADIHCTDGIIAAANSGNFGMMSWRVDNGTLYMDADGPIPEETELNGVMFSIEELVYYVFSELNIRRVVIGEGVTEIPARLFAEQYELETVSLPSTLTKLGAGAFDCCYGLTSINIPPQVTVIEEETFRATSLTSVELPAGLTTIGDRAFATTSLESIQLPEGLTMIGDSAFRYSENLTNVTIPGSVKTIGKHAFTFSGLTTVVMGKGVEVIGDYAFSYCRNLKEVTLPESVQTIGEDAFDAECMNDITFHTVPGSYAEQWVAEQINNQHRYFNIVLELNGGILTDDFQSSYLYGTFVELPYPEKEGYVFQGWLVNGELETEITIKQDVTAEAIWYLIPPMYELTLELNGGSLPFDMETEFEEGTVLTLPTPTMDGYAFLGWLVDGEIVTEVVMDRDITAEASWAILFNLYELTLELNGGSLPTELETVYGEGTVVTLPIPVKEGYIFQGWMLNGETVTEVVMDRDITVEAGWKHTVRYYQLTLELNGGTLPDNFKTEYVEGAVVKLPIPVMEGYNFTGWQLNGERVTEVTVNHDMVITASWEEIIFYTLTLVLDGGVLTNAFDSVYAEGTVVKLPTPEKNGFVFMGWTVNGDAATEVTLDQDTTAEAVWIAGYKCGENLIWTLSEDGCLEISGTGSMYHWPQGGTPWYDYRDQINRLTIHDGLTVISEFAFYGCTNLNGTLELPASVFGIGESAFAGCTGLTGQLVFPENMSWIGWGAFEGCTGFTGDLVIPDSVTLVSSKAFKNCTGFDGNLVISNSMDHIAYQTFYNCNGLTGELVIPDGITGIDIRAFFGCEGFSGSLVIPDSVASVGISAFSECCGFDGSLVLPYGLTEVADGAFQGCSGLTGDLVIPDGVTSIGKAAFMYCSGFTGSIVIPEGVISIGSSAFYECSGLIGNLVIPDTVIAIGGAAFGECRGLTGNLTISKNLTSIETKTFRNCGSLSGSLVIPDHITSIGTYAFEGCTGFDGSLVLPDSITIIGEGAFEKCSSLSGDIVIPYYVTEIGSYAFKDCSGFDGYLQIRANINKIHNGTFWGCKELIGDIVIPDGVTVIETSAFDGCTGFDGKLVLPDGLTSISAMAFYECTGLTGNLELPESLQIIGANAFSHCKGFTGDLAIPAGVSSIGGGAFAGCSGFTGSLTIPEGVSSIGGAAFRYCSGFTGSLTIPDGVTNIGECAFYGCSGFTGTLEIPASVTIIERETFYGCSGFTGSLVIPNGVTGIGFAAFCNCNGFDGKLVIPASVNSIGALAFSGCSGFTGDLVIPEGVTSIEEQTFHECSGFNGSLVIPNSVTSIGYLSFSKCSGLKGNLVIPDSVTSIKYGAFWGCSGLTGTLVIPDSVTSIGSVAFADCSGFTGSLVIPDSVTSIGSSAFARCSGFTGSLVIPDSVTSIGEEAFEYCSGFTGSLVIPDSVTSIGEEAFEYCSGFTGSLVIPDSVTSIGRFAFWGREWDDVYLSGNVTELDLPFQKQRVYNNIVGPLVYAKAGTYALQWANSEGFPTEIVPGIPTRPETKPTLSASLLKTTFTPGEQIEIKVTYGNVVKVHYNNGDNTFNPNSWEANGIHSGDILFNENTSGAKTVTLIAQQKPGKYHVTLWAKNAEDKHANGSVPVSLEYVVESEKVTAVSGRVCTSDGSGICDATVILYGTDGGNYTTHGYSVTNANGYFTMLCERMGAGQYTVFASPYGFDDVSRDITITGGEKIVQVETLVTNLSGAEDGNSVSFTMYKDGELLTDTTVSTGQVITFAVTANGGTLVRMVVDGIAYETAVLENGAAVFDRAFTQKGTRSVTFQVMDAEGKWGARSAAQTLTVDAQNGSLQVPAVTIAADVWYAGTALPVTWSSVPNAEKYTVHLYNDGGQVWQGVAEEEGSILIPGNYVFRGNCSVEVIASAPGYTQSNGSASLLVEKYQDPVVIESPGDLSNADVGTEIEIRVSVRSDIPAALVWVQQNGKNGFRAKYLTDDYFSFTPEAAGDYTITPYYSMTPQSFEREAADGYGASVTVHVTDPVYEITDLYAKNGGKLDRRYHRAIANGTFAVNGKTTNENMVLTAKLTNISTKEETEIPVDQTHCEFSMNVTTKQRGEYILTVSADHDAASVEMTIFSCALFDQGDREMFVTEKALFTSRPDGLTGTADSRVGDATSIEINVGDKVKARGTYSDTKTYVIYSNNGKDLYGFVDSDKLSIDMLQLEPGEAYLVWPNDAPYFYANEDFQFQVKADENVGNVWVKVEELDSDTSDSKTLTYSAYDQATHTYTFKINVDKTADYAFRVYATDILDDTMRIRDVHSAVALRRDGVNQKKYPMQGAKGYATGEKKTVYLNEVREELPWLPIVILKTCTNENRLDAQCYFEQYGTKGDKVYGKWHWDESDDTELAMMFASDVTVSNPVVKRAVLYASKMKYVKRGEVQNCKTAIHCMSNLFASYAGVSTQPLILMGKTEEKLFATFDGIGEETDYNDRTYVYILSHGDIGRYVDDSLCYINTDILGNHVQGDVQMSYTSYTDLAKNMNAINGQMILILDLCHAGSAVKPFQDSVISDKRIAMICTTSADTVSRYDPQGKTNLNIDLESALALIGARKTIRIGELYQHEYVILDRNNDCIISLDLDSGGWYRIKDDEWWYWGGSGDTAWPIVKTNDEWYVDIDGKKVILEMVDGPAENDKWEYLYEEGQRVFYGNDKILFKGN